MKTFIKLIKQNFQFIAKTASKWTTAVYAFVGLISLFVSFEGLFCENIGFWKKVLISFAILAGVWIVCIIIVSMMVRFTTKKKVVEGRNGNSLFVVYGDLFNYQIEKGIRQNLCFAVNRCFDTIVDDKVISSNSIHGQAFNKLYKEGTYNTTSLNEAIQNAIHPQTPFIQLNSNEKPAGNTKRYEVGTCVDISINHNLNFFLVGMTSFDSTLTARTTLDEYAVSIQKMIEFCNDQSQGYPVLMPIIGAKLSRLTLDQKQLLQYMINAFRLNKEKINTDVYIIIREKDRANIPIVDL